jgi:putative ABC transport system permease protein
MLVLLGLFSILALALAAIGIYGVVAYSVALRTREIGIRVALGAPVGSVLRMVLMQGVRIAIVSVAVGWTASIGLTRLMSKLLYSVNANDPTTLVLAAAVLTIVTLAACYIPARRAMRVDPMVALRHE